MDVAAPLAVVERTPPARNGAAKSMLGQRIRNYRIVREIGQGGMAIVYEAVREDIGSRAALKILRPEYAANEELAARFLNEARAANMVEHPGIVRIFDYGREADGTIFLAMEYLEGETLYRRFRRAKQLSPGDVTRLGRQIASALAAAHAKQVIHRDLKPENILIIAEAEAPGGERVKVLDFGLAKLQTGYGNVRTGSNLLMGTPVYMSPEQCRSSRNATDRSDVYALGTIFFELLAGRPPFVSKEPGEYIAMHMYDQAPALGSLAPNVPVALMSLVDSMIEKAPEKRPAMTTVARTMRELGVALTGQRTLDGEQDSASYSLDAIRAAEAGLRGPVPAPEPSASGALNPLAVTYPAMQQVNPAKSTGRDQIAIAAEAAAQRSDDTVRTGDGGLGRAVDTVRRSLDPRRFLSDPVWSIFAKQRGRRRWVTTLAAAGALVATLVGLFFLGRSSVRPPRGPAEVTRPVPDKAPPVAAASPPVDTGPPVAPPATRPPLPAPPEDVAATLYHVEQLTRIGATADALKELRRAIAKRPHQMLWSTMGQLACRKDKLGVANQALASLEERTPTVQRARDDLLLVCKTYDILEDKTGKLVKLGGTHQSTPLRIKPVR